MWICARRACDPKRRRCHQRLFAQRAPTGIEPTAPCLQTAEAQIPHKIRPDVVLTGGTLGQTGVPIEYRLPAKTRRFAGTSSNGASRSRTGDLLLAKAVWGSMGGVGRARMPIKQGLACSLVIAGGGCFRRLLDLCLISPSKRRADQRRVHPRRSHPWPRRPSKRLWSHSACGHHR